MGAEYKKIIVLSPLSLSEKLIKDFYILELAQHFLVEYWDFSLTFPHVAQPAHSSGALNYPVEIKKFKNLQELDKAIVKNKSEHPATLFIVMATYNYKVMPVFKLLTKHNAVTAIYARGMNPSVKLSGNRRNRIKWMISLFSSPQKVIQVASNILALHFKKTGRIKPHNIIFQAGGMGIYVVGIGAGIDGASAEIVHINHFDFDKYLEIRNNPPLHTGKYAVFLDDCLPGHPDTKMLNIQTVEPVEYYKSLNDFFDYVEKEYQVQIIIAAHPKSDYITRNPFGNRKVVYGQTAELVKDATFTIAHLSTSVSYAVLFRKPLFFITNNPIENLQQRNIPLDILGLAAALGRKVINIDNIKEREELNLEKDEEKYKDYIYNYLSSPESDSHQTVDVVLRFLGK